MYAFLLGIYPGIKLLVHKTYMYSAAIITAKQFSKIVTSVCSHQQHIRTPVALSLSTLGIINIFSFNHSNGCVVVSPFVFYFSDNEVEHLFKYLLAI